MTHFTLPMVAGDPRRAQVLDVLDAALDAVDPVQAIRRVMIRGDELLWIDGRAYDLRRFGRIVVVGGGKAGASMAAAVEELLGDRITAGVVNVKYDHSAPTEMVTIREAGHPVPDGAGAAGAREMLALLRGLTAGDLVLCLISGGASALMTLPVERISLDDMQQLTTLLLRSGAPIQAINTVRKHLSQISGGQLARAAYPAQVVSLILSDVVGSPLDVIGSGPTVPDPTTYAHAQAVLERYGSGGDVPESILSHLRRGLNGVEAETPKPGDVELAGVQNVIVADNERAAEAAIKRAEGLGFHTLLLSTFVEGEAREVARVTAALAKEIAAHDRPIPRPACLIMGGETTVTVRGQGQGGRNQELALAAAIALQGVQNVMVASLATDGSDGPTDGAGGLVDGTTVERGSRLGLSAQTALDQNDAYPFLRQTGDLLVTGPTRTNVNDLMTIFVFDE